MSLWESSKGSKLSFDIRNDPSLVCEGDSICYRSGCLGTGFKILEAPTFFSVTLFPSGTTYFGQRGEASPNTLQKLYNHFVSKQEEDRTLLVEFEELSPCALRVRIVSVLWLLAPEICMQFVVHCINK